MMNGRHLPAGQGGMPPDVGRRRQYNQHQHQQHQQYPPQMYNNYMPPYNANYYPQPPPQYQHAPMPQQYAPYPTYVRSPPPHHMQHYPPAPLPQQQYPRPQASPIISTPYQPPPPPPQAPSSTQSSHTVPVPATPPAPAVAMSVAPVVAPASPIIPDIPTPSSFRAPLPWFSSPELEWPTRRQRRKRKPAVQLSQEPVELPSILGSNIEAEASSTLEVPVSDKQVIEEEAIPRPETPSTNHAPSEEISTNPTTPSSQQQTLSIAGDTTPVASKPLSKTTVPAVPVIPALPKSLPREPTKASPELSKAQSTAQETVATLVETHVPASGGAAAHEPVADESKEAVPAPPAWSKPKVWSGLFNPPAASAPSTIEARRGSVALDSAKPTTTSLADILKSFSATSNDSKIPFIEPRGLVNSGNMCYMNSVLQVLIFCVPFYTFLDKVKKGAVHRFNSETPILDSMLLFLDHYKIIDSAASVEQLRMRLKERDLEMYGLPFTPDFVYNVINRLPRFSSMRRGHQQDAEEFLGFLLEGLHDECVQVMRSSDSVSAATPIVPSSPVSEGGSVQGSASGKENGWLEVGPKQKAAVTRSSGTITTGSPITKIFGGNLRSELRVPGLKDSVTLEPYQPLQLDIGAPHVNNIVDALKGLTRSEPLHGDFKSPKGPNVTATKQVFIETVPPVLILHLKRFQYDNTGGTQKIWKKVGYPLELELPKEVFPRQQRSIYAHGGLPKYQLIAVVYHHGKNASGGHYTVDVRRQEGREWIRLDDTVIRRIRSEDVAEGGSEEDPKVLAAALEAHKKDPPSANGFAAIEDADENEEDGWKQASGPGKKWSSVVNGASTPKAKTDKFSIKDNKVAYMLFYQRI